VGRSLWPRDEADQSTAHGFKWTALERGSDLKSEDVLAVEGEMKVMCVVRAKAIRLVNRWVVMARRGGRRLAHGPCTPNRAPLSCRPSLRTHSVRLNVACRQEHKAKVIDVGLYRPSPAASNILYASLPNGPAGSPPSERIHSLGGRWRGTSPRGGLAAASDSCCHTSSTKRGLDSSSYQRQKPLLACKGGFRGNRRVGSAARPARHSVRWCARSPPQASALIVNLLACITRSLLSGSCDGVEGWSEEWRAVALGGAREWSQPRAS
jgi:hypothetical protein